MSDTRLPNVMISSFSLCYYWWDKIHNFRCPHVLWESLINIQNNYKLLPYGSFFTRTMQVSLASNQKVHIDYKD